MKTKLMLALLPLLPFLNAIAQHYAPYWIPNWAWFFGGMLGVLSWLLILFDWRPEL